VVFPLLFMHKRLTYLFTYLLINLFNYGQINLVSNPSFEDTIGDCQSQMAITTLGSSVKNWYTNYYSSSADYYNTCANAISYPNICTIPYNSRCYQNAHLGDAYMGLYEFGIVNSNDSSYMVVDYISVKLKETLKPNTCYYGEFYTSLGDISQVAINQISMLIAQNTFSSSSLSIFTNTTQPQIQWDTTQIFTDTLNWVKISGKFIAQGGEQYLTIGNFRDGTHLKKQSVNSGFVPGYGSWPNRFFTYILIDDVSLYELPTPHLQSNAITICPNSDSLLLGDTARIETSYKWFENGIQIANTSTITVKPTQNTTYVLQSTNCSTTTQSVIVTYSANCEPVVVVEPVIPNVFTPNNDSINDVWRFNIGKGNVLKEIKIYNRWGTEILNDELKMKNVIRWDGYTTSGEPVASGVYFYVLQYTDANGEEHKKNGYVTLIR
jgi:gliding motility-associated-like protein